MAAKPFSRTKYKFQPRSHCKDNMTTPATDRTYQDDGIWFQNLIGRITEMRYPGLLISVDVQYSLSSNNVM